MKAETILPLSVALFLADAAALRLWADSLSNAETVTLFALAGAAIALAVCAAEALFAKR